MLVALTEVVALTGLMLLGECQGRLLAMLKVLVVLNGVARVMLAVVDLQ